MNRSSLNNNQAQLLSYAQNIESQNVINDEDILSQKLFSTNAEAKSIHLASRHNHQMKQLLNPTLNETNQVFSEQMFAAAIKFDAHTWLSGRRDTRIEKKKTEYETLINSINTKLQILQDSIKSGEKPKLPYNLFIINGMYSYDVKEHNGQLCVYFTDLKNSLGKNTSKIIDSIERCAPIYANLKKNLIRDQKQTRRKHVLDKNHTNLVQKFLLSKNKTEESQSILKSIDTIHLMKKINELPAANFKKLLSKLIAIMSTYSTINYLNAGAVVYDDLLNDNSNIILRAITDALIIVGFNADDLTKADIKEIALIMIGLKNPKNKTRDPMINKIINKLISSYNNGKQDNLKVDADFNTLKVSTPNMTLINKFLTQYQQRGGKGDATTILQYISLRFNDSSRKSENISWNSEFNRTGYTEYSALKNQNLSNMGILDIKQDASNGNAELTIWGKKITITTLTDLPNGDYSFQSNGYSFLVSDKCIQIENNGNIIICDYNWKILSLNGTLINEKILLFISEQKQDNAVAQDNNLSFEIFSQINQNKTTYRPEYTFHQICTLVPNDITEIKSSPQLMAVANPNKTNNTPHDFDKITGIRIDITEDTIECKIEDKLVITYDSCFEEYNCNFVDILGFIQEFEYINTDGAVIKYDVRALKNFDQIQLSDFINNIDFLRNFIVYKDQKKIFVMLSLAHAFINNTDKMQLLSNKNKITFKINQTNGQLLLGNFSNTSSAQNNHSGGSCNVTIGDSINNTHYSIMRMDNKTNPEILEKNISNKINRLPAPHEASMIQYKSTKNANYLKSYVLTIPFNEIKIDNLTVNEKDRLSNAMIYQEVSQILNGTVSGDNKLGQSKDNESSNYNYIIAKDPITKQDIKIFRRHDLNNIPKDTPTSDSELGNYIITNGYDKISTQPIPAYKYAIRQLLLTIVKDIYKQNVNGYDDALIYINQHPHGDQCIQQLITILNSNYDRELLQNLKTTIYDKLYHNEQMAEKYSEKANELIKKHNMNPKDIMMNKAYLPYAHLLRSVPTTSNKMNNFNVQLKHIVHLYSWNTKLNNENKQFFKIAIYHYFMELALFGDYDKIKMIEKACNDNGIDLNI